MVRQNDNPSDGVDANKGVSLEDELRKAGTWTGETSYPEGQTNREPIDIRADIEPEKKG